MRSAKVTDLLAETFAFKAQKTLYGEKRVAKCDAIFVFASENEGGLGPARAALSLPLNRSQRKRGIARQTLRVSITIKRSALAKRPLGRSEFKRFAIGTTADARLINFKFYRQATNKIVGISEEAAAFIRGFF